MRYLLPVVRQTLRCLAVRWHARYAGQALFPEGREHFELGSSVGRGSWGLMPLAARHAAISPMRAVLGWLPGGAQIGSASPWQAWCWTWPARSAMSWDRCQVVAPDGMSLQRWWNAREPGQRTWVDRRRRWEAPVEDGGHVACGFEVASASGCRAACAGVGASRFRPRGRAGGPAGSARRVQW